MTTLRNLPEQRLYIDGGYADAQSEDRFETVNPATGEVICTVQSAGAADVERAVEA
ncbi:MAG: aldehyde dehydrogenase family protein, partial [Alphaproteobacteria bacterium]